jgi:hypothetical protein
VYHRCPWGARGGAGSDEAPAQVVAGALDAREREEVAAAGRLDVVHQGLPRQPVLDLLELPGYVLLVAAEDEPDVQIADVIDPANSAM